MPSVNSLAGEDKHIAMSSSACRWDGQQEHSWVFSSRLVHHPASLLSGVFVFHEKPQQTNKLTKKHNSCQRAANSRSSRHHPGSEAADEEKHQRGNRDVSLPVVGFLTQGGGGRAERGGGGGYPRHRWGRDDASQKPLKPLLVSCLLFAECSQSPRAHSLNGAAINGLILCSYTGITLQLHWRTLVSLTAASWLDSQWFPHPQAPLPKRRRRDLVRKPMGDERQQPTTATDTAPPPGWGWGIF